MSFLLVGFRITEVGNGEGRLFEVGLGGNCMCFTHGGEKFSKVNDLAKNYRGFDTEIK